MISREDIKNKQYSEELFNDLMSAGLESAPHYLQLRIFNTLYKAGLEQRITFAEYACFGAENLRVIKNIGKKSLRILEGIFEKYRRSQGDQTVADPARNHSEREKPLREALEQIRAILANVPDKGFWAWQANARADALRIATQSLVAAPENKS